MVGAAVAVILDDLQVIVLPAPHRRHDGARDGDGAHGVAGRSGFGEEYGSDLRWVEDAAHGLRRIEVVHNVRFLLERSLAHYPSLGLLD